MHQAVVGYTYFFSGTHRLFTKVGYAGPQQIPEDWDIKNTFSDHSGVYWKSVIKPQKCVAIIVYASVLLYNLQIKEETIQKV